jgi:hypothetical protein
MQRNTDLGTDFAFCSLRVGAHARQLAGYGLAFSVRPLNQEVTMMAVIVGLVIISVLILAVLVKMWDLKRKREGEAVIVQSQISDALLREPALFSLAVTPTAHVPLWKGSPVTVEVAGQVPSEDLRDAALRAVEREASRLRSDVRIESRIGVVPTMARRSA